MATIYPGQVFPAYIKPQHNVHGPIRFSYKGMWPDFRHKYFLDIRAAEDDAASEAVAISAMELLITKWNLEYPKDHPDKEKAGKPVPITAEAIKSDVMSHVRNHMINIITWGVASDVDPEAPVAQQVKAVEQKAAGKKLAELMAEADAALVGN
jgi:hypothetical protein